MENLKEAIAALVPRLRSRDSQTRLQAASGLVRLGSEAVPDLLDLLPQTRSTVSPGIIGVLARIGDTRAVEPLIGLLADQNYPFKTIACEALGLFKNTLAVEPLIAVLRNGISTEAGMSAAGALGMIGDARAISALSEMARSAGYNLARAAAVDALGRIGGEEVLAPLLAALDDPDERVRRTAADTLAHSSAAQTHPSVQRRLAQVVQAYIGDLNAPELSVCSNAAYALGQIGDTSAVEPLLAMLQDASDDASSYAAGALGHLKDRRAVKPLIDSLRHGGPKTRYASVTALGRIGGMDAYNALAEITQEDEPQVWSEANRFLNGVAKKVTA